jgi:hypothetical protein
METPEIVQCPDPKCRYCGGRGWIEYQLIDDIAGIAKCACDGGDEEWVRQLLRLPCYTYCPVPDAS